MAAFTVKDIVSEQQLHAGTPQVITNAPVITNTFQVTASSALLGSGHH
jgi:hypothetical protein